MQAQGAVERSLPIAARSLAGSVRWLKAAADVGVWGGMPVVAYLLMFDGRVPEALVPGLVGWVALGTPAKALAVWAFGLHRQSWRHVTFRDAVRVLGALGIGFALEIAIALAVRSQTPLPRLSIPLTLLLSAMALVGMRASRRLWAGRERQRHAPPVAAVHRVLVVGAGETGRLVVAEMRRHPEAGLQATGLVDDDPHKRNLLIDGVPVLGVIDALPRLQRTHPFDQVVLAINAADGALVRRVKRLVEACDPPVPLRLVPGMVDILAGGVRTTRLRDVRIEDLLRRDSETIDLAPVRAYLAGTTVLVTGGGGSIGSELVRQLLRVGVARVIALGHGENSLFELMQRLGRRRDDLPLAAEVVPVVADVRDPDALRQVFARYRPDVVFHAAAHKHVPLMEAHPEQAVLNNVLGTRHVVAAAVAHGVRRLVNISSDKAVNPTSVMGATKRLAEQVVRQAAIGSGAPSGAGASSGGTAGGEANAAAPRTYVSVRFGNVLGSRGSVIPLFRRQIEEGGPVTVTDPGMTRYFMTIPEAAQLVLQAGALAEPGAVYYLDMGQPVRITDLAEDMIRLSGLRPHVDVELAYVGMRPGEKLYEELTTRSEVASGTAHAKVFRATAGADGIAGLDARIDALAAAARAGGAERVRELLAAAVPFAAVAEVPAAQALVTEARQRRAV
jgi:FlaA1/EpsC-like NDP-sugar epimerase